MFADSHAWLMFAHDPEVRTTFMVLLGRFRILINMNRHGHPSLWTTGIHHLIHLGYIHNQKSVQVFMNPMLAFRRSLKH
uniref:Uncharacterized protein n=1 Tax=Anguilla anguilla TaxID=7936 RepID=A0A0E9UJK9_ANGAN